MKLPIHFAPIQGYTDAAYRNLHARLIGGVEAYYSPFVRIERGTFRQRDLRDVDPQNNTVPHFIPQFLASDPEEAKRLIDHLAEMGHKEMDINMGCPFPILVKKHKGCGVLPHPTEVEQLMQVVRSYGDIRFSLKLRLGWERVEETLALASLLNELPLKHITIHARYGIQQYKGEVDDTAFGRLYEELKHPLIYNGDLLTRTDLEQTAARFPRLAGVMMGRGLLANPFLAIEYAEDRERSRQEQADILRTLHRQLLDHYAAHLQGDVQLLTKMKTFWEYLLPDADRKMRKAIHKSGSLRNYEAAVATLFQSMTT